MNVTEGAFMGNQSLKKTEEEEKPDDITAKPQDVDDENETQVGESSADKETVMDDVKEDVEKDPEAEKEGEGMAGVGEAEQTVDLEETRKLSEELPKVEDLEEMGMTEALEETVMDKVEGTKIAQVSERNRGKDRR
ncbi:hypothetical protein Rs2_02987 [Raphanus sativus]|nr:hypothetical protein Rs2_02987 [Raphanus sativus]